MAPLFVNRKVFYLWLPREFATQNPFPPPVYYFSRSESRIPVVLFIGALRQGLRLSDNMASSTSVLNSLLEKYPKDSISYPAFITLWILYP